ncbi:histidine kinase osmosensor [Actinomortierella ambigua]|nr:histidine kinase osmosensor [Actinomortierella ambigua]
MRSGRTSSTATNTAFTFDMARFLDFACEASSLLEALHQHGLIHGQLCPSSFAWELDTGDDYDDPRAAHGSEHRRYESHSLASSQSSASLLQDYEMPATLPRAKTVHPLLPTPPHLSTSPHTSHPLNARAPGATMKPYTLTLDCTHLGLKAFNPIPGAKGLRPVAPSPPLSTVNATPSEIVVVPWQPEPATLSSSPGSASTTHSLHDAFSRVTRLTKSLMSSSPAPSSLPQFLTHVNGGSGSFSSFVGPTSAASTPATSPGGQAPTSLPSSLLGSPQQQLNKHFLLYMPRELYVQPGCTLPAQVDIHSLGVLFYYLLTAHSTLTPLDLERDSSTAALMSDLKTFTIGYGSTSAGLGAHLPTTATRLSNILQRMVSKVPTDRYISMIQVRKELSSVRDQEREAAMQAQSQQQQQQQEEDQQQHIQRWPSSSSSDGGGLQSNPLDQVMSAATTIPLSFPNNSTGSLGATSTGSPKQHSTLTTVPVPITRVPSPFDDSPTEPVPLSQLPATTSPSTHGPVIVGAPTIPIQAHITVPPRAANGVQSVGVGLDESTPQFTRLARATVPPRSASPAIALPLSPVSSTRDSVDFDQAVSSSFNMSMTAGLAAPRRSVSSGSRISQALDNILSGHPPEEMAIVLWQKDDNISAGGSWSIVEEKLLPGNKEPTLTWTSLSDRRDHMPVLVRKSLDTQEPIFSTALGSKSQLPTIACIPILSAANSTSSSAALVGVIYLHHLHPRFYFSKRDRELLVMFCQRIGTLLINCDQIAAMGQQLTHAMNRIKFLEDLDARNQQNEHEITAMMEALPFFIWTAERDDVVSRRYLSRSWFDWTGLPGESKTSDKWLSVMHPEDLAGFQKETAQSYKNGACKDCEFRLMRYDGMYRWHLSRAVPILNHKGEILLWIGVTMDIDDLYLAQKAELRKKSTFLANMSHELRTPFSGFHGMLTLLSYTSLTEEQQECVYTAKASCEKLLLIIDDLLDFSKLEADKVTLESAPFDLEDVFNEVESIVKPLADQKGLDLVFVVDDNVPPVLIGDANRLKQILLNLAGNAIKFTHEGHIAVRCRMLDRDAEDSYISAESGVGAMVDYNKDDNKFYFRHEQNGAGQCQSEKRAPNSGRFSSPEPLGEKSIRLIFFVEDSGIGIGQDAQETLFSPFSQVDGSATRHYGGSGLGLSICLQLVKLMKGRIGLDSTPGKGSTFWFVVQCEEGDIAKFNEASGRLVPIDEVRDSSREIKRITRALGAPTILIASASEQTVNTLVGYLSASNTEVVNTPEAAVSLLLEKKEFDFVCWDFPKDDPSHEVMLSLHARPELVTVNFVLLYTPAPTAESVRRTQSLQIQSSGGSLASEARRRPVLSQSISLRMESSGNLLNSGNSSSSSSNSNAVPGQQEGGVPGLDPIHLKSRRIICISKPIRRLKLLKAFVEILEGSSRIQDATAGSLNKSAAASAAGGTGGGGSADKLLSPRAGGTPISGPSVMSMVTMSGAASGAFVTSQAGILASLLPPPTLPPPLGMVSMGDRSGPCSPPIAHKGPVVTPLPEISSTSAPRPHGPMIAIHLNLPTPPEDEKSAGRPNPLSAGGRQSSSASDISILPSSLFEPHEEGGSEDSLVTPQQPEEQQEEQLEEQLEEQPQRPTPTPSPPPSTSTTSSPKSVAVGSTTSEGASSDPNSKQDSGKEGSKPSKLSTVRMASRGRSNSPKPVRQSMLVSDEKSDVSLCKEEAAKIAGLHVLLAEDNFVAQRVLSRQLSMFGLKVACANDGAEAIALFKSHPRGHFKLGFFDHHMPNCDGVQATQQIRALEKEHAAEVKGPVPRLPLVAVSADIQEVAMKACLNSGMERYVTKPLMQRDLVAMVRHYLVEEDLAASVQPYNPPQQDSFANVIVSKQQSNSGLVIPSTAEARVTSGLTMTGESLHVASSSSGSSSFIPPPSTISMPVVNSPPPPAPKKEIELSEAALRGLALIRECSLNDESSKVGGGGTGSGGNNVLLQRSNPTSPPATATATAAGTPLSSPLAQITVEGSSPGQSSGQNTLSTGRSLYKSVSTSSLSTAFRSGGSLSSNSSHNSPATPSLATFPSLNASPAPGLGGATSAAVSSHHHCTASSDGLRAVAAMAAAAVVNSVSTAIERHLPTPSIHATASSKPHYPSHQQQPQSLGSFPSLPLPASLTAQASSASSIPTSPPPRAGDHSPASSSQSANEML